MSAIAAAVGGSKTTLWSAFPSKESLFAAVLDDLVAEFRAQTQGLLDPAGPLADTLGRFGRAMLGKLLSDTALRLRRLIYAEVERFPEIGRLYYERGPEQSQRTLATFLAEQMAAGQLRPADPLIAAAHFLFLIQAGMFQRAVLKIGPQPSAHDIAADAQAAVHTFLRAYAPDQAGFVTPATSRNAGKTTGTEPLAT